MTKADVGMIGLAVMGANLARNLERNGFTCAVYNRSNEVTERFMGEQLGKRFIASATLQDFVASIERPRRIFIMIKAGSAVDDIIETLLPILSPGDILIDGGNAYFRDSMRRVERCQRSGIEFLGVGISGGEEGALNGASIMPGGSSEAWERVRPLLEKIAAYAEGPCTTYIGPDGAGHFVKTVHNGIEYADMQLIAEAYDLLRTVGKRRPPELSSLFRRWNEGVLQSFLIEITADIFTQVDEETGGYLVDSILDKAGQKGTGKWTVESSLDLGVAIPTISAAVDARALSAIKDERVEAAEHLRSGDIAQSIEPEKLDALTHDALYCAKIISYAQGMALLARASAEWNWSLRLGDIAAIWKGGCIIRARFLEEIRRAYADNPVLKNLLLAPAIRQELSTRLASLREVVALATRVGIPVPAFSASLSYYDQYRAAALPLNLTQAQRDYFGAHTYERIDRPGSFHTSWIAGNG
jgi:6-phosphogluconate dehydrogenase